MKYLIVGSNGQLGQELQALLRNNEMEFVAFDSRQLDITNKTQVVSVLSSQMPDVVLDAAAYTAVDKAEDDGKDANWLVNEVGTKNLVEAANEIGATMVYVSTDYVFDGTKDGQYLETDATNPQNEYGRAKLAGEYAVAEFSKKYYIVRTSWVFGEYGQNFVFTMQKLANRMSELKVVNDQIGRPTWTKTLAEFLIHLVSSQSEYGVYHLSNDGEASWFDFAKEILKDEPVTIEPVDSNAFPQKAYRPKHSVMSLEKAKQTGFVIEDWRQALSEFLKTVNHVAFGEE